jgi:rhodanese-related sulfurtransferase
MKKSHDMGQDRLGSRCFVAVLVAALVLVTSACSDSAPQVDPAGQVTEISQEELLQSPPANVLVLDVRTPAEYDAGHVPHAINVPHDQLAGRLDELAIETDRPIVVYCKGGVRADNAAKVLIE